MSSFGGSINLAPVLTASIIAWGKPDIPGINSYPQSAIDPFIDETDTADGINDEKRCESFEQHFPGENIDLTCISYTERLDNPEVRELFPFATRSQDITLNIDDLDDANVWARIVYSDAKTTDYPLLAEILREANPNGLVAGSKQDITCLGVTLWIPDNKEYSIEVPQLVNIIAEGTVKKYLNNGALELGALFKKVFQNDEELFDRMTAEDKAQLQVLRSEVVTIVGDKENVISIVSEWHQAYMLLSQHDEQSEKSEDSKLAQAKRYKALYEILLPVLTVLEAYQEYFVDAQARADAMQLIEIEDAPEEGLDQGADDDATQVGEEQTLLAEIDIPPSPAVGDGIDAPAEVLVPDDISGIYVRLSNIDSGKRRQVDLVATDGMSFTDPDKILGVWCAGDLRDMEPCDFTGIDDNGYLKVMVSAAEVDTKGSIIFYVRYKRDEGVPDEDQPVFSTKLPVSPKVVEIPIPPADTSRRAARGKVRPGSTPVDIRLDPVAPPVREAVPTVTPPLLATGLRKACEDYGASDVSACVRNCTTDYELIDDNPRPFQTCVEDN